MDQHHNGYKINFMIILSKWNLKSIINQFLIIFNNNKEKFKFNESLKSCLRDINNKNSYFTHSIWKSEYHQFQMQIQKLFKLNKQILFIIKLKQIAENLIFIY